MNKDKCNCEGRELNHNHVGGGSFVVGALLGAVAVFFFATPRGNKMLKYLMENGLENFSQYFDEEVLDTENTTDGEELVSKQKQLSKRFFKGTKK